jgi:hypothetical protein
LFFFLFKTLKGISFVAKTPKTQMQCSIENLINFYRKKWPDIRLFEVSGIRPDIQYLAGYRILKRPYYPAGYAANRISGASLIATVLWIRMLKMNPNFRLLICSEPLKKCLDPDPTKRCGSQVS